ncbi:MAG: zinc ABC transporter substrate-binding protein [Bacteroidia bacterium]|nr:zinc ABC transporter substrate-binding protein [Bacteroidia bacterium]
MLRILPISLFLLLLSTRATAQDRLLQVVTTTSFLEDLAAQIVGVEGEVHSVLPVGTDPHIYDPVPEDAKIIAEADLLIKNGLTLEGWLEEMMANAGKMAPVVTATAGVEAIHSYEHANASDPHAWMNPLNAVIYIGNIRDGLITVRPSKAAYFEANYQAYKAQLEALDAYIQRRINQIPPEKRILATSHDAFRYFGNKYGIEVQSILGTSTEAEPTLESYQKLLGSLSGKGIPAVFVESTINPKLLTQLAGDLGIVVGGKLYADSLGDEESGADSYLKMLRQNTDVIVNGLLGLVGTSKTEDRYFLLLIISLFAISFGFVAWRLRLPATPPIDWNNYQINIRGLSVSYDKKTALSNVYLSLEPGHVYGLIGGNGSGKSTLFKSILGLVEPDSGSISVDKYEINDIRKHIAYIPQKEEIDWSFPATVSDIVQMGRFPHRKVFERLTRTDHERSLAAMKQLGIEDLHHKQIGELSGGQQQRVFIARALCQDAEIFLFDEPFVGVDITTENRIIEIVKELAKQGKLVIIIHHDLAKVKDYFDRLIMMNQRVVAIGDTNLVFNDDNIRKTYGGQLTMLQRTESYR